MYFNETERLRKDSDFRRVYKHGKSFANRYLVMYIMRNNLEYNREVLLVQGLCNLLTLAIRTVMPVLRSVTYC